MHQFKNDSYRPGDKNTELAQTHNWRPLDSRTRTTTSTIIELKIYLCIRHPGMLKNIFIRKDSNTTFIEGGDALS